MLSMLNDIKERGIKNIIDENIELVKELGILGALKAKTEQFRENVLGAADHVRKAVVGGEKIGSTGTYSSYTEFPDEDFEEYSNEPEIVESKSKYGKFRTGI